MVVTRVPSMDTTVTWVVVGTSSGVATVLSLSGVLVDALQDGVVTVMASLLPNGLD